MLKMKIKGPWKELNALMKNYDQRVAYTRQRIGKLVVEALVKHIKDGVPGGEEYQVYKDSLEAIELTGDKKAATYAVISKRMPIRLGDVAGTEEGKKTVVYFHPAGEGTELAFLLASVNPWPVDLVPHGVPEDEVVIINRIVTEGEMKFARERVEKHISKNKDEYRRHGIKWGTPEKDQKQAEELSMLPDYMSLALRTEFGINAELRPHWKPAILWVIRNIRSIIEDDKKIKAALHDPVFRDHTLERGSGLETMSVTDFAKARNFQSKVTGN